MIVTDAFSYFMLLIFVTVIMLVPGTQFHLAPKLKLGLWRAYVPLLPLFLFSTRYTRDW